VPAITQLAVVLVSGKDAEGKTINREETAVAAVESSLPVYGLARTLVEATDEATANAQEASTKWGEGKYREAIRAGANVLTAGIGAGNAVSAELVGIKVAVKAPRGRLMASAGVPTTTEGAALVANKVTRARASASAAKKAAEAREGRTRNRYPTSKEEAVAAKRKAEEAAAGLDLRTQRDKQRNIGYQEGQVGGEDVSGPIISGKRSPEGSIPMPVAPRFKTKDSGAMSRRSDTEPKGLEHAAAKASGGATGHVTLFTGKCPCASCAGVIDQFRESFPGVEVQVIQGSDALMRVNLFGRRSR
jgi:hypothetical protein